MVGESAPSRWAPVVVAAGFALVLAACGSGDDEARADRPDGDDVTTTTSTTTSTTLAPSTTATTTAPEPATTGSTAPPGSTVLVELRTSGGLDGGGNGNLLVTAAGEVTVTGRDGQVTHGTLAAGELDALADLLAGTDFAGLAADPDPGSTCADAFVYTVRYHQWTANADDCTTPTDLAPVLARLQDLLTRFA